MYTIISDGGNRQNITYGSFKIYDDEGTVIVHRQMIFGYGTSNLAEYLAMIRAVKHAQALDIKEVVILTDSKLVQKQVFGDWQCNYQHLKSARNSLRKLLNNFDSWKINKVSRNIVVLQLGH
jgi:ribonuclease HI